MLRIFLTKLPPEVPEHTGGVGLALCALRKVSGAAQSLVYDARGKPYVVGGRLFVSLSNSRGVCAAAVSDKLIGVDTERRAADPADPRSTPPGRSDELLVRLAARWFCEEELRYVAGAPQTRFPEIWTAKESYVKMTGDGLSGMTSAPSVLSDPRNIYVRFDDELVFGCACLRRGHSPCEVENIQKARVEFVEYAEIGSFRQ